MSPRGAHEERRLEDIFDGLEAYRLSPYCIRPCQTYSDQTGMREYSEAGQWAPLRLLKLEHEGQWNRPRDVFSTLCNINCRPKMVTFHLLFMGTCALILGTP